jgi:hypothetical protein
MRIRTGEVGPAALDGGVGHGDSGGSEPIHEG